jgi:hypothetical protein
LSSDFSAPNLRRIHGRRGHYAAGRLSIAPSPISSFGYGPISRCRGSGNGLLIAIAWLEDAAMPGRVKADIVTSVFVSLNLIWIFMLLDVVRRVADTVEDVKFD